MTALSHIRKVFRYSRWLLLVLLALIIVAYFTVIGLLQSTAFANYVLREVEALQPKLAFTEATGNLREGITFNFQYSDDGVVVSGNDVVFSLSPACFLRAAICIEKPRLEYLDVRLLAKEGAVETWEPVSLPQLAIPVPLEIDRLRADRFSIHDNERRLYQLESLFIDARWRGDRVTIYRFKTEDDFCQWDVSGNVSLRNNYPLNFSVSCDEKQWQAQFVARVAGDLHSMESSASASIQNGMLSDVLGVTVENELTSVQVELKVAALTQGLPFEADFFIADSIEAQISGDQLNVSEATVAIDGNINQLSANISMLFASQILPGDHAITADVDLDYDSAHFNGVRWQWREAVVDVQADVHWNEGVQSAGVIQLDNLTLEKASSKHLSWLNKVVLKELSGEADWKLSISGDQRSAEVNMSALDGYAEFGEGDNHRSVNVNGHALAKLLNNNVYVDEFVVQSGEASRASLSGMLVDNILEFKGSIELDRLQSIDSSLAGGANMQWALHGPVSEWVFRSNIQSKSVSWEKYQLAQLQADIDWHHSRSAQNSVRLSIAEITLPNGVSSQLTSDLTGTLEQQSLTVKWHGLANQADKFFNLNCHGGFNRDVVNKGYQRWIGRCLSADLRYSLREEKHWGLDRPFDVDWSLDNNDLTLSSFCFHEILSPQQPSSLVKPLNSLQRPKVCSNEYIRYANGDIADINVTGDYLPFSWLESLLPEKVAAQGEWSFAISGEQLLSEQNIRGDVLAEGFAINVSNQSNTVSLPIDSMRVSAQWRDKAPLVSWEISTPDVGAMRGHVHVVKQSIEGELVIDALQLDRIAPLLVASSADKLQGSINAELTLSGPLEFPLLNGELDIRNGFVQASVIPAPIEAINLSILVEDNAANLRGGFTSLSKPGEMSGEFGWDTTTWAARFNLKAQDLEFKPEPRIELRVSPDVTLKASPQEMFLSGNIHIPWARVEIRSLPDQAVMESPDAIVIGADKTTEQKIHSELNMTLGDDVLFKGFGLDTFVGGALRFNQSSNEPLRANGTIRLNQGRFKAYGQNLVIREGDLVFVNTIDNPQLRLDAIRDLGSSDIIVGLRATGPAAEPDINLFSEPPMSQQEQISYLLTGGPPNDSWEVDPTVAAAEAALTLALESDLGSDLTRQASELLGIEDVRVTTISNDSGPQVGVSGYLTSDLKVSYGIGVFDAVNSLTLNYRLTKNVFIEMTSGESSAFDVLWNFSVD